MLRRQRAIEIVPGSKPLRWRRYDVPQHLAPETSDALRFCAVEGDLELLDRRHRSTIEARGAATSTWPGADAAAPADGLVLGSRQRVDGCQRYPAGLRASQTVRLVRTVRSSRADRAGARASSSAMSPALSLSSRPCRARQKVAMAYRL